MPFTKTLARINANADLITTNTIDLTVVYIKAFCIQGKT